MEKIKIQIYAEKQDLNEGVLLKNLINVSDTVDRAEGNDGQDYRMVYTDPYRDVDLPANLSLLHIDSRWDETDATINVIAGKPAPVMLEINGVATSILPTSRATLEGPGITALRIKSPNDNGKRIKVRIVAAGA